jgi:hypothetical protein
VRTDLIAPRGYEAGSYSWYGFDEKPSKRQAGLDDCFSKFCLAEGIFEVEGGLIIRRKLQTANGRTTPVSDNFRSFREGVQAMPGTRPEKRAVLIERRKRRKR